MIRKCVRRCAVFCLTVLFGFTASAGAADEPNEELIQMVVELVGDPDRDVRAVGLEQVRSEARGPAATKRFAKRLTTLSADAQTGLLSALADRGDKTARPAVLEAITGNQPEAVRLAAIEALGSLGEIADLPMLCGLLASESGTEQAAARKSLVRLQGDGVSAAIADTMKRARPAERVALIEILTARRALDVIPDLLAAAIDADPAVRSAAMIALGQLADQNSMTGMVQGILKAEPGAEREAAEKAVTLVCSRIKNPDERVLPLLAAIEELPEADRLATLTTVGRVGGSPALQVVEAAIAGISPSHHNVGLRAICNWPDASITARLIELAESEKDQQHRSMALAALIRVAPLPDQRPSQEKLLLLAKAMSMCTSVEEQDLILKRARAIRAIETLRFVMPYLDQAPFAQQACETVVELAHHRQLREPNKVEFDRALDKVIATSTDATVVDRANRYKRGQTWARPATADKS